MKQQLEQILASAQKELSECGDLKVMEELRVKFLGKKGELTAILKQMGGLSAEERPIIGQLANKVRSEIEAKITEKAEALKSEAAANKMAAETIDVTLPGKAPEIGRLHPLTAVLEEVKEIFLGMGFDIVDGPRSRPTITALRRSICLSITLQEIHRILSTSTTMWFSELRPPAYRYVPWSRESLLSCLPFRRS